MVLGRIKFYSYVLRFDGMKISSADEVTLLGVTTDNKLTLKNHIDELCRKAPYTFHALRRIRSFFIKGESQVACECFYKFSVSLHFSNIDI